VSFERLNGHWSIYSQRGRQYHFRKVARAGRTVTEWEHRVVMELMLGRPLTRKEHVHHRDGDGLNNEPYNLKMVSAGEHRRLHARQSRVLRERSMDRILDRMDWKIERKRLLAAVMA
jgi:hypothetical protein